MNDNKKKKESVPLSIRIPKEDLDQIRKLAEDDGRTLNNFICRIIHNYLESLDNSD